MLKRLLKPISWALIFCFTATSLQYSPRPLYAEDTSSVIPAKAGIGADPRLREDDTDAQDDKRGGRDDARGTVEIPNELGTIEKVFLPNADQNVTPLAPLKLRGEGGVRVYYIQDAHNSLEAQENIAKLIQHLVKEKNVGQVLVEGYEGDVPLDPIFSSVTDPKVKERVSHFFVDYLRLNGARYAFVNRDRAHDFKLTGIESTQDYLDNLKAYKEGAKDRELIAQDLGKISKELQTLADRVYPKEIKEWQKLKERFDSKQLSLADYVFRMMKLRSSSVIPAQAGISTDPRFREDDKRYPHLALITAYLGKDNLTKQEQEELNEKFKQIDTKVFFNELQQFEQDFSGKYLTDPVARQTFMYQERLSRLSKLNQFQLTPEEYAELITPLPPLTIRGEGYSPLKIRGEGRGAVASTLPRNISSSVGGVMKGEGVAFSTAEIAHFLAENLHKSLVLSSKWEELIAPQIRFYELAKKRDENFQKYLVAVIPAQAGINTDPRRREDDNRPVIIVTGGFHESGITEFLEKEKISYAVVSPKITKDDPVHEKRYDFLMTGQHYPFEKPFLTPALAALQPQLEILGGDVKGMVSAAVSALDANGIIDPKRFARTAEALRSTQKVLDITKPYLTVPTPTLDRSSGQSLGPEILRPVLTNSLQNAFQALNKGKPLPILEVEGVTSAPSPSESVVDYTDIRGKLIAAFEAHPEIAPQDYAALILRRSHRNFKDAGKTRDYYRILLDRSSYLQESIDSMWLQDELGKFEFILEFVIYPEEKLVHFNYISLGKEHVDTLRGKGLAPLRDAATVLEENFRGFQIVGVPAELKGRATRIIPEYLERHFQARPLDPESREAGELAALLDLTGNDPNYLYQGVIGASLGDMKESWEKENPWINPDSFTEWLMKHSEMSLTFVRSLLAGQLKMASTTERQMLNENTVFKEFCEMLGLELNPEWDKDAGDLDEATQKRFMDEVLNFDREADRIARKVRQGVLGQEKYRKYGDALAKNTLSAEDKKDIRQDYQGFIRRYAERLLRRQGLTSTMLKMSDRYVYGKIDMKNISTDLDLFVKERINVLSDDERRQLDFFKSELALGKVEPGDIRRLVQLAGGDRRIREAFIFTIDLMREKAVEGMGQAVRRSHHEIIEVLGTKQPLAPAQQATYDGLSSQVQLEIRTAANEVWNRELQKKLLDNDQLIKLLILVAQNRDSLNLYKQWIRMNFQDIAKSQKPVDGASSSIRKRFSDLIGGGDKKNPQATQVFMPVDQIVSVPLKKQLEIHDPQYQSAVHLAGLLSTQQNELFEAIFDKAEEPFRNKTKGSSLGEEGKVEFRKAPLALALASVIGILAMAAPLAKRWKGTEDRQALAKIAVEPKEKARSLTGVRDDKRVVQDDKEAAQDREAAEAERIFQIDRMVSAMTDRQREKIYNLFITYLTRDELESFGIKGVASGRDLMNDQALKVFSQLSVDRVLKRIAFEVNKKVKDHNAKNPKLGFPELDPENFKIAANEAGIDVFYFIALAFQETEKFDFQARSGPDGRGLIQINPETLKHFWLKAQKLGIVPKDKPFTALSREEIDRILFNPNNNVRLAAIVLNDYFEQVDRHIEKIDKEKNRISQETFAEGLDRMRFAVLSYSRGTTHVLKAITQTAKENKDYWDYGMVTGTGPGSVVDTSPFGREYPGDKDGRRKVKIGIDYVNTVLGDLADGKAGYYFFFVFADPIRGKSLGEVEDFDKSSKEFFDETVKEIGNADVVVTIPVYNEISEIAAQFETELTSTHGQTIDVRNMIYTVKQSLENYLAETKGKKALILLVGETKGEMAKTVIQAVKDYGVSQETEKVKIRSYGKEERFAGWKGKKWAIRLGFQIARALQADLAVLDGDLTIEADWISKLFGSIRAGSDYVSPDYVRHYGKDDISLISHFHYPFFSSLFGKSMRMPDGGEFAVSRVMLDRFLTRPDLWTNSYFIEDALAAISVGTGANVRDVWLGEKVHKLNPVNPKDTQRFDSYIQSGIGGLFHVAENHPEWWRAQVQNVDIEGIGIHGPPAEVASLPASDIISKGIDRSKWIASFKAGYKENRGYYLAHFRDLTSILEQLYASPESDLNLTSKTWAKIVFAFLKRYLETENSFEKENLPLRLKPFLIARVASFAREVKFRTYGEAEELLAKQAQDFAIEKVKVFSAGAPPTPLKVRGDGGVMNEGVTPPSPLNLRGGIGTEEIKGASLGQVEQVLAKLPADKIVWNDFLDYWGLQNDLISSLTSKEAGAFRIKRAVQALKPSPRDLRLFIVQLEHAFLRKRLQYYKERETSKPGIWKIIGEALEDALLANPNDFIRPVVLHDAILQYKELIRTKGEDLWKSPTSPLRHPDFSQIKKFDERVAALMPPGLANKAKLYLAAAEVSDDAFRRLIYGEDFGTAQGRSLGAAQALLEKRGLTELERQDIQRARGALEGTIRSYLAEEISLDKGQEILTDSLISLLNFRVLRRQVGGEERRYEVHFRPGPEPVYAYHFSDFTIRYQNENIGHFGFLPVLDQDGLKITQAFSIQKKHQGLGISTEIAEILGAVMPENIPAHLVSEVQSIETLIALLNVLPPDLQAKASRQAVNYYAKQKRLSDLQMMQLVRNITAHLAAFKGRYTPEVLSKTMTGKRLLHFYPDPAALTLTKQSDSNLVMTITRPALTPAPLSEIELAASYTGASLGAERKDLVPKPYRDEISRNELRAKEFSVALHSLLFGGQMNDGFQHEGLVIARLKIAKAIADDIDEEKKKQAGVLVFILERVRAHEADIKIGPRIQKRLASFLEKLKTQEPDRYEPYKTSLDQGALWDIENKTPEELKMRARFLKAEIDRFDGKFRKAVEEEVDHKLHELNAEIRALLALYNKIQLKRALTFTEGKSPESWNTTAVARLLLSARNQTKRHELEVLRENIRNKKRDLVRQFSAETAAYNEIDLDLLGAAKIADLLTHLSQAGWDIRKNPSGGYTVPQRRWVKEEGKTHTFYRPEIKNIVYEDLSSAIRSQVHTIENQLLDIGVIQERVGDLEDVLHQIRGYSYRPVTQKEMKRALRISGEIEEWLEKGLVDPKTLSLPHIKTALTALEIASKIPSSDIEVRKASFAIVESNVRAVIDRLEDDRVKDIDRIKRKVGNRLLALARATQTAENRIIFRTSEILYGVSRLESALGAKQSLDLTQEKDKALLGRYKDIVRDTYRLKNGYFNSTAGGPGYRRSHPLIVGVAGALYRLEKVLEGGGTIEKSGVDLNLVKQNLIMIQANMIYLNETDADFKKKSKLIESRVAPRTQEIISRIAKLEELRAKQGVKGSSLGLKPSEIAEIHGIATKFLSENLKYLDAVIRDLEVMDKARNSKSTEGQAKKIGATLSSFNQGILKLQEEGARQLAVQQKTDLTLKANPVLLYANTLTHLLSRSLMMSLQQVVGAITNAAPARLYTNPQYVKGVKELALIMTRMPDTFDFTLVEDAHLTRLDTDKILGQSLGGVAQQSSPLGVPAGGSGAVPAGGSAAVPAGGKSHLDHIEEMVRKVAKVIDLPDEVIEKIIEPEHVFRVEYDVVLKDGTKVHVLAFRVQHNNARGPYKGGIRYVPVKIKEEALEKEDKGLAFGMTLKTAVVNIPLGGGKGVVNFVLKEGDLLNRVTGERDPAKEEEFQAKLMRGYDRSIMEKAAQDPAVGRDAFGAFIDSPAPDMGTGAKQMAWGDDDYLRILLERMRDKKKMGIYEPRLGARLLAFFTDPANSALLEDATQTAVLKKYLEIIKQPDMIDRVSATPELAAFTGKPVDLGGSQGRTKATGQGGLFVLETVLRKLTDWKGFQGFEAAVQGYGNVGGEFSKIVYERGVKIIAISTAYKMADGTYSLPYAFYHQEGIDIPALEKWIQDEMKARKVDRPDLFSYEPFAIEKGYQVIPNDDFWALPVDVFVPAAGSGTITKKAAEKIVGTARTSSRKPIILELANGPTTPEADEVLKQEGIIAIPDILANTGGVSVSFSEMHQNIANERWDVRVVDRILKEKMVDATNRVMDMQDLYRQQGINLSFREATYLVAVMKLAFAEIARNSAFKKKYGTLDFIKNSRGLILPDTQETLRLAIEQGLAPQMIKKTYTELERQIQNTIDEISLRFSVNPYHHHAILVTGATASGKSVISDILTLKFEEKGKKVRVIDVNRQEITPENMTKLLSGKAFEVKSWNDRIQRRIGEDEEPISADEILILEGAEAYRFEDDFKTPNVYRIFVHADPSFSFTIDKKSKYPLTSYNLRRLRDLIMIKRNMGVKIDGQLLIQNLRSWTKLRNDENPIIFKNLERADQIFNLFDPFELAVMRDEMLYILMEATEELTRLEKTEQKEVNVEFWRKQINFMKGLMVKTPPLNLAQVPPKNIFNFLISGASLGRQELDRAAQPYIDLISKGDVLFPQAPDVFLVLGNPDIQTYLSLAAEWKRIRLERQVLIPIVLAGGRGRGTPVMIDKIKSYYGEKRELNADEILWLGRAKNDETVTETKLMRFILTKEGVTDGVITAEDGPSRNTAANFTNSLSLVEIAVRGAVKPTVAVVTAPQLLLRIGATARKLWKDKIDAGWSVKALKLYGVSVKDLEDDQLIELLGYTVGYPEKYRALYPALNGGREFRGSQSKNNPNVETPPMSEDEIKAGDKLEEDTQAAFERFLAAREVVYDAKWNRLTIRGASLGESFGKAQDRQPVPPVPGTDMLTLETSIEEIKREWIEGTVLAEKISKVHVRASVHSLSVIFALTNGESVTYTIEAADIPDPKGWKRVIKTLQSSGSDPSLREHRAEILRTILAWLKKRGFPEIWIALQFPNSKNFFLGALERWTKEGGEPAYKFFGAGDSDLGTLIIYPDKLDAQKLNVRTFQPLQLRPEAKGQSLGKESEDVYRRILPQWLKEKRGQLSVTADDGAVFEFRYADLGEDDKFVGIRQGLTVFYQGKEVGHFHFRVENTREGKARAYISFNSFGDTNAITVKRSIREKYRGIGRSLVGLALRFAKASELTRFEAMAVNPPAEAFFENLGFKVFRTADKSAQRGMKDYEFSLLPDRDGSGPVLPAVKISKNSDTEAEKTLEELAVELKRAPVLSERAGIGKVIRTTELLAQVKENDRKEKIAWALIDAIDRVNYDQWTGEIETRNSEYFIAEWFVGLAKNTERFGYEIYLLLDAHSQVRGFLVEGSNNIWRISTERTDGVKGRGTLLMDVYFQHLKQKGVEKASWTPSRYSVRFFENYLKERRMSWVRGRGESDTASFIVAVDTFPGLDRIAVGPFTARPEAKGQSLGKEDLGGVRSEDKRLTVAFNSAEDFGDLIETWDRLANFTSASGTATTDSLVLKYLRPGQGNKVEATVVFSKVGNQIHVTESYFYTKAVEFTKLIFEGNLIQVEQKRLDEKGKVEKEKSDSIIVQEEGWLLHGIQFRKENEASYLVLSPSLIRELKDERGILMSKVDYVASARSPAKGQSLGASLGQVTADLASLSEKPAVVAVSFAEWGRFGPEVQEEILKHLLEERIKIVLTDVPAGETLPFVFQQKSKLVHTLSGTLTSESIAQMQGFTGDQKIIHLSELMKSPQAITSSLSDVQRERLIFVQPKNEKGVVSAALLFASGIPRYQEAFKKDPSGFWIPTDLGKLLASLAQNFLASQFLAQAA